MSRGSRSAGSCATAAATPSSASGAMACRPTDIVSCRWLRGAGSSSLELRGRSPRDGMPAYRAPMINLYARDLPRAAAFYAQLGFVGTCRTPATGQPSHVELTLDGFKLGIVTIEAARKHHGLRPE